MSAKDRVFFLFPGFCVCDVVDFGLIQPSQSSNSLCTSIGYSIDLTLCQPFRKAVTVMFPVLVADTMGSLRFRARRQRDRVSHRFGIFHVFHRRLRLRVSALVKRTTAASTSPPQCSIYTYIYISLACCLSSSNSVSAIASRLPDCNVESFISCTINEAVNASRTLFIRSYD